MVTCQAVITRRTARRGNCHRVSVGFGEHQCPIPSALPILLEHLQRPYPAAVREGIARALAVRKASFAWGVLTHLYRSEQEVRVKDGLAVAICAVANAEVIDDLIALARDTRQGPSRLLLFRVYPNRS